MSVTVDHTTDAVEALAWASDFLHREPVLHNLVLSLLHARAAAPQPGRYWVARVDGDVAGVAFQSPLDFAAVVTPMPPEAVAAVVRAVEGTLPGVHGDVATAAHFAGEWTEHRGTAAFPAIGMRVYECGRVESPDVGGTLRPAHDDDRGRLIEWTDAFYAEMGEPVDLAAEAYVDTRRADGHLWVWEVDSIVTSMAAYSAPVASVVRVHGVYTPPEQRRRGYAGACVAALSERLLAEGLRVMLYTDLGNPTSNSVYRRIGFQAVAECLRYRFA